MNKITGTGRVWQLGSSGKATLVVGSETEAREAGTALFLVLRDYEQPLHMEGLLINYIVYIM